MNGTVLLIEDDDDIADVVRLFFEKEGFKLVHAETGEAGVERVAGLEVRVAAVIEVVPVLELEGGLEHGRQVDGLGHQSIGIGGIMLRCVPAGGSAARPRRQRIRSRRPRQRGSIEASS